jgi:anti-anti-sigma factor
MREPNYVVTGRDGAREGQRVLVLGGPLDMAGVPEFLRAARSETAPVIILDFSQVSFIDSTGVGALIQLLTSSQKAGRRLALAAVGPRVMAVLDLTRVKGLFNIFGSVYEAEEKL